ncbi:MAG: hypothetical protein KDB84_09755 [Flavobacteriales bacterium]|nr:hypothetical protein [Flavobacteriales bacterium]
MSILKNLLPFFLAMVVTLAACRKESDTSPTDRDYVVAVDNSRAEQYFNDALKLSDAAYKDLDLPCAVSVTLDTVANPHTLLIDLGPTNCTAADGWARRGRLLVSFTGAYRAPGTVITITPQDYYVQDHHVQGTKTVTNGGTNGNGQTYFTVAVDGTVTAPDGSWTSSHHYERTRTWVAGEGTLNLLDDVYLITGVGNGVNRNGLAFTLNITSPLRVEVGCPWIVSGVEQITPANSAVRTVDFGNGACDAQVSVTVNGFTFTFG